MDAIHSLIVSGKMVFHLAFVYWIVLLICSTYYAYNIPDIPPLDESSMDSIFEFNRIVGGHVARIEDYPYQGSMVINDTYFCGCFIMSENWIGTAAHCVENTDPSNVVVRVGSRWRHNGTIIEIEDITVHPGYDNPRFDKDMAIMKTAEPINFTDTIQPVKQLPYGQYLNSNGKVNISGWGRTQEGAPSLPYELMALETNLISDIQCYMSYIAYYTENMFCVGRYWFGLEGTCQGDSGGAVVQDGMLLGIVSFGRGCGRPLSPGVCANVTAPAIHNFMRNVTGL